MKVELTLTEGGRQKKSCKFHINLNIHCFYITIFIFNQSSVSILCGVMIIIMVFDAQILVLWLYVDVHIGKISNSTLLCQYFIYTHTHIEWKITTTPPTPSIPSTSTFSSSSGVVTLEAIMEQIEHMDACLDTLSTELYQVTTHDSHITWVALPHLHLPLLL